VEEPAAPGRGGARGGAGCRGGGSVEEPATPGCSCTGAVGGGERVPALDYGAAVIDLSEWAWTRGRARVKSPNFHRFSQPTEVITVTSVGR
jgi:hypothetical protein